MLLYCRLVFQLRDAHALPFYTILINYLSALPHTQIRISHLVYFIQMHTLFLLIGHCVKATQYISVFDTSDSHKSLWNRLDENTRKITNYESFKDTLMANTIDNPLFYVGSRQEQIIMAKLRMGGSNLNGHLYSMKLIDSPACSCGFINENEFHFFLVCPLYNRPRVTLQNAMGNIAPFTLRTLLYGSENLDLTVNKRIVTETLRFIKDSKRFDP